jgi:hypothetical protein
VITQLAWCLCDQVRLQKEEYEALARLAADYKSQGATQAELDAVNRDIAALEEVRKSAGVVTFTGIFIRALRRDSARLYLVERASKAFESREVVRSNV